MEPQMDADGRRIKGNQGRVFPFQPSTLYLQASTLATTDPTPSTSDSRAAKDNIRRRMG